MMTGLPLASDLRMNVFNATPCLAGNALGPSASITGRRVLVSSNSASCAELILRTSGALYDFGRAG